MLVQILSDGKHVFEFGSDLELGALLNLSDTSESSTDETWCEMIEKGVCP